MTRQTSKKAQLQRFSGPELSELLALVASEHGPQAAIAAVNRVRSGGVGGFFCREEFEVIVDLRGTERRSNAAAKAAKSNSAKTTTTKSTAAKSTAANKKPKKTASQPTPAGPSHPGERRQAAGLGDSDGGVAPITPTIDLASPGPVAQTSLIQPPALPKPPGSEVAIDLSDSADETHAGFMEMLQRRLDETADEDAVEAEQFEAPAPAAPVPPVAAQAPTVANEAANQPGADLHPAAEVDTVDDAGVTVEDAGVTVDDAGVTVEDAGVLVEELGSEILSPHDSEPIGPSGFWLHLHETEDELAGFMPVPSAVIAIVGPLSLTTQVVRRMLAEPEMESADVLVLTGRTEIVSEPKWQLIRSGTQLIEEVERRINRRTILVLDVPVDLPNWVPPLQSRLHMAGVSLFRFAVPGEPTAQRLDAYRQACDVPYALDLMSRVGPNALVDFVANRHPIASVAGADMTAELLLALREQVGLGR